MYLIVIQRLVLFSSRQLCVAVSDVWHRFSSPETQESTMYILKQKFQQQFIGTRQQTTNKHFRCWRTFVRERQWPAPLQILKKTLCWMPLEKKNKKRLYTTILVNYLFGELYGLLSLLFLNLGGGKKKQRNNIEDTDVAQHLVCCMVVALSQQNKKPSDN